MLAQQEATARELSSLAPGRVPNRIHESHSAGPLRHATPVNGTEKDTIVFGRFCVRLRRRELLADGVPVAIGNRALDVLLVLIEASGQLVTKDELLSRVWPNTIVEENNLQFQISTLRRALGQERSLIKTVSGRGYCFVGDLETESTDPHAGAEDPVSNEGAGPIEGPKGALATVAARPSLAVLPFHNLSRNPDQDYFADGMTEDIVAALSRFKSFSIISPNSSFAYRGHPVDVRQISRDIGVRYVLKGSVRRAGKRLRVVAELTDATSGVHLWADHFDVTAEEVFDVQDRIAESVVGLIEPHVLEAEIERSRCERPGSLQAYDLYLRALSKLRLGNPEGNATAHALLAKAIALEPDNGVFLAEAARVVEHAFVMGWPALTADDRASCIDLARRALANAGGDASIMATCGLALIHANAEFELGLAMLRRAVEANPNQFRVLMSAGIGYLHCGSIEDALFCLHRAVRLSPASSGAHMAVTGIAHAELVRGECREAVKWAEQSLALSAEYQPTYWILVAAKAKLGLLEEARRWRDRFLEIVPHATVALIRAAQPQNARVDAFIEGLKLAELPES